MDNAKKNKIIIGIAIAAVAIVCAIVPYECWSGELASGKYMSTGEIVNVASSKNQITVRLYSQTNSDAIIATNNIIVLQGKGDIPKNCYSGQRVLIAYSEKGLTANLKQSVEVVFFEKSNLLFGLILRPFSITGGLVMRIVDTSLDGSTLGYNVTS